MRCRIRRRRRVPSVASAPPPNTGRPCRLAADRRCAARASSSPRRLRPRSNWPVAVASPPSRRRAPRPLPNGYRRLRSPLSSRAAAAAAIGYRCVAIANRRRRPSPSRTSCRRDGNSRNSPPPPAACCRGCRRRAARRGSKWPSPFRRRPLTADAAVGSRSPPPSGRQLASLFVGPSVPKSDRIAPKAVAAARRSLPKALGTLSLPPPRVRRSPSRLPRLPLEETASADALAAPPPPPAALRAAPPSPPVAFADAFAMPPFVAVALAFAVALPPSPAIGRRASVGPRPPAALAVELATPSKPLSTAVDDRHPVSARRSPRTGSLRRARVAAGRRGGCADAAVGGRAGCVRCRGRVPATC